MPGTQTTVLVSGDPEFNEGKATAQMEPGDLVRTPTGASGGSVGSVEKVAVGGTPTGVHVVAEYGSVTIDDSYSSGDRVMYYTGGPGDELYANVDGTVTGSTINAGELLGGPNTNGTAGHFGQAGNGTLVEAGATVAQGSQKQIKLTVV